MENGCRPFPLFSRVELPLDIGSSGWYYVWVGNRDISMKPLFGKSKLLLIDGNHMLHRMLRQPRLAGMCTSKGDSSGGVFGFLKSLRSTIVTLQGAERIITVFDGGNSERRSEIFPEYRVRPPIEDKIVPGQGLVNEEKVGEISEDAKPYYEVFGHQKRYVRDWMRAMGSPVIRLQQREGDDIIFQLTKMDAGNHLCVIVSEDKDFLQLLSPTVHVYRPISGEYYDPDTFRKKWGFQVRSYRLFKALTGDTSDMVPGVKGIGEKFATEIVNAATTPKEVIAYCKEHKRKNIRETATSKNRRILKRNLQLFDMRKEEFSSAELRKIRKLLEGEPKKVDWGTLRRIASEMELHSLAGNLNLWMRPFKQE